jgi:four helix bundle protein
MKKEELKLRTKKFALSIINLVDELPNTLAGRTIGNQIIRSGTSVAANYRAACRAKTPGKTIRNRQSAIRNENISEIINPQS